MIFVKLVVTESHLKIQDDKKEDTMKVFRTLLHKVWHENIATIPTDSIEAEDKVNLKAFPVWHKYTNCNN